MCFSTYYQECRPHCHKGNFLSEFFDFLIRFVDSRVNIVFEGIDATLKTCWAEEKIYEEIFILTKDVGFSNFIWDENVHFCIVFVVQSCNYLLLKTFDNIYKKMFVAFNKTRYVARGGMLALPPVQQYIPFSSPNKLDQKNKAEKIFCC